MEFTMANETDATFSFWQLINLYKIEIPIIQRDYAQGRENTKAKYIREKIISSIFETLFDAKKPLSFDFVYGRVADGVFIPIDGQQRLTTLWLLHLYLLKICIDHHKDACGIECPNFNSDILSRFTYRTRQSSREFCKALVEKNIIPLSESGSGETPIEDYIKDQLWFWPDWKADPTVAGMLRTLDVIHLQFNKPNAKPDSDAVAMLIERLFSDQTQCPINFKFLDMGAHDLTDDLYLKMNARGLSLKAWENFKAQLEQCLKNYCRNNEKPDWLNEFSNKLDGKWLDFFWTTFFSKTHPSQPEKTHPSQPERYMLEIFRRHLLNVWVHASPKQKKDASNNDKDASDNEQEKPIVNDKQGNNVYNYLRPAVSDDLFTPFSVYEAVLDHCKIDETLKPIINLFEALANKQVDIGTKPAWGEKIWNPLDNKYERADKPAASDTSRVRFYAVMKCFSEPITGDITNFESKYKEWMRVVWNILENTSIKDDKGYLSALELIDELGSHWDDILNWLSEHGSEIETGFAKAQIDEEIEKAKLIVADATWKQHIDMGERHYILKGSLRFLMHGDGWQKNFELRLNRFLSIFGNNDSKEKRVFAFRAFVSRFDNWELLCRGLVYDASEKAWRNILRKSTNDDSWIEPLYEVLDSDSDATLNNWIEGDSLLRANCIDRQCVAHEVLFQTNIIGKCESNSLLRWKDDCYLLLPKKHSANYKKIVLDLRHLDLCTLENISYNCRGLDCWFNWQGDPYVWCRDGKIYEWDAESNSPRKEKSFVVSNNRLICKEDSNTEQATDSQTTTQPTEQQP